MRIISGKHKGRRIIAPKNLPVRPTKDMANEALFNILNNTYYLHDLAVLDLFAGTGNISFEFASRGSTMITSVDIDGGCVQFISKISEELDFNISAVKQNVFSFLEQTKIAVDVIFADPPYEMDLSDFEKISKLVFENHLLTANGLLVIEHAKQTDLSHLAHFTNARKYGGSVFSFFENQEAKNA